MWDPRGLTAIDELRALQSARDATNSERMAPLPPVATGTPERDTALRLADRSRRPPGRPWGQTKHYDTRDFVHALRHRGITPNVE